MFRIVNIGVCIVAFTELNMKVLYFFKWRSVNSFDNDFLLSF
jgi:hypothetical protein